MDVSDLLPPVSLWVNSILVKPSEYVEKNQQLGEKDLFLNSTSYFDSWGKNGILKPSVRK